MPRYYDKPDATTTHIVKALRDARATVDYIQGRNGRPDLVVGANGQTYLMEVVGPDKLKKFPPRGLMPKQEAWHNSWQGGRVYVVKNPEEALGVIE